MIEINLDSTNRKNNKLIIDGEDICQKYKVTGFNIKYDADKIFPILSVDIWDEIKLVSDGNEMIMNRKCIGNNHIWINKKDDDVTTSSVDIIDLVNNIEYSNYSNNMPKDLDVEISLEKFENANISDEFFVVGRGIDVSNNDNLQYSGTIKEIIFLSNVLHITARA